MAAISAFHSQSFDRRSSSQKDFRSSRAADWFSQQKVSLIELKQFPILKK